jgi:hypothetical protein
MATLAELLRNPSDDGQSGANSFSPESGQVKLQQFNPQNMSVEKTVDYTIPKEQIRNFNPSLDSEGNPTGAGIYILNDGSQMFVGADGIVTAATPGRNEYTLNQQGYYQPTGAGLTWNGEANLLTKKIGGLDVPVSPYFQKGGYQDERGNLRLDQNGVPVALAPNFIDSGYGQSGLSDAAPYIAAALTLAATGMPTGFEGMVPASQTLAGGFGAGATSGGFGLNAAGTGGTYGSLTAPGAGYTYGGLSASQVPTLTTGLQLGGAGAGAFGVKDAYDAYKTANQAMKLFSGGDASQAPQYGSSNVARTGSNYNYQNQPFLNAQQQSNVYAPTGLNVSGATTPSLDVSRNSNLLANLLRR